MRFYQNLGVCIGCLLMAGTAMADGWIGEIFGSSDDAKPAQPYEATTIMPNMQEGTMIVPAQGGQPARMILPNKTPYSILVCQSKQCAKAEYSMTREFLYNRLLRFFETNLNKNVSLCEADPISRVCYNPGIRIPAQNNLFNLDIQIPSFRVLDTKLLKNPTSVDLIFDYTININGMRAVCQSAVTRLSVDFVDKAQMVSPAFGCRFTATGNSSLNASYNIDYVDFDYGIIGAHYTIGAGQAVRGGKSGYTLMRFTVPQTDMIYQAVEPEDKIVMKKTVSTETTSQKTVVSKGTVQK